MKSKLLIDTNPYLKDKALREKLILKSVTTSSAVEGIYVDINSVPEIKITKRRSKKIYQNLRNRRVN